MQHHRSLDNTFPPPGHRSQHLPPPPPWAQVTTPPSPPGHRSQHLPPPSGHRSQHPLPPRHRSQHLPPPPPPRAQVTTPPSPPPWAQVTTPPPRGLYAGGRYASYWNAFLFVCIFHNNNQFDGMKSLQKLVWVAPHRFPTSTH